MAAQRSRCNTHEGMSMYMCVSEPLFLLCFTWLSGTDVWGQLTRSAKKKNLCAEQTTALSTSGLWECGRLGGGKEARKEKEIIMEGKLCQRGRNCVKVTIYEVLPFKWGTKDIGLVCTTLSVVSSFIVLHHSPNWRRPSVGFRKRCWPPQHTSADSCGLNCPLESCTQAKCGKWGKKINPEIWERSIWSTNCMHRIIRTTHQIINLVAKSIISAKSVLL